MEYKLNCSISGRELSLTLETTKIFPLTEEESINNNLAQCFNCPMSVERLYDRYDFVVISIIDGYRTIELNSDFGLEVQRKVEDITLNGKLLCDKCVELLYKAFDNLS